MSLDDWKKAEVLQDLRAKAHAEIAKQGFGFIVAARKAVAQRNA
jgi:hypothetical protein